MSHRRHQLERLSLVARLSVGQFVAVRAERDQVLFLVATGLAPEFEVVHL